MRPHMSGLLALLLTGCVGAHDGAATAASIPAAQSLFVDFDEDGGRDEARLVIDQRLGAFSVQVRHDGQEIYPFFGDLQPSDRIGLEWRQGDLTSDVRCRGWKPGMKCGYVLGTHMPMAALVVHHSRLGEFLIIPVRQYARPQGMPPPPLRFGVGKAYEPTTRLKTYGS